MIMNRKLLKFSLLSLVLMLGGMGYSFFTASKFAKVAAEPKTIFSANATATSAQNFATGTTEITSDQATIVGGKMYAVSQQEAEKALINKQGSTFYFCMTNNNTYFKVELDSAIAVGDVITADGLGGVKNDLQKGLYVTTTEAYPSEAPACTGRSATESIVTNILNYTVTEGDEYVGKKTLYIYRSAGATEYFGNFKIKRTAAEQGGEGGGEGGEETPGEQTEEPVVLTWDYTSSNIPTTGPDNGLYYAGYVNDAAGTNLGLHGVKLNSSGYAFFAKPAVKGTLTLTIGDRKDATKAYAVDVYSCTISEGAATKGNLIGSVSVDASPNTGSLEIPAEVTGIYIQRQTTSEGVLSKIVFKQIVPRKFVDFEITNAQMSGEFDATTLPTGVTFSGTQRNDNHGYGNVTLTVPVDGTVKFTIGGCQYAGATFTVTDANSKTLATLDPKTTKCYHQDGSAITYLYVGEATTLTFNNIEYLPYFKAEATEVSEATITFVDQDGKKLGEKVVYEGDAIGEIPYTEADLTIAEGMKFRGWTYMSGVKVKTTDVVSGNVTIKASVTAIESVSVGSIQSYDLTSSIFYPEDHETIDITGAKYENNHGWNFAAEGSFTVDVAGKAQVVLTLCEYGSGTTIKVTDGAGSTIKEDVPAKAETDGGLTVVKYDGEATRLTFTFATQAYLHKIAVYNVKDFMEKDALSGYYIVPAGDAASLIMAINTASAEEGAKVFLPNGTYDLGNTVKTIISGKNVSLIGQSAENTIITTKPVEEGLDKADLLKNTGEGLYMQDISLKNNFSYGGNDGRAASLHDTGTKTVCKNVFLLSYQDTYYSHKVGGLYYFEGGELHGTVDYLCGNGKVYYDSVKLVNEVRGSATITANSEMYVFNNCTVENNATTYNLGRAWSDNPVCVYLNTTLLDPDRLVSTRWNLNGINCDYSVAGEYGTKNAAGENITPARNVVTFTKANITLNTILDEKALQKYSMDSVLGDWAATAKAEATQVAAPSDAELATGKIQWTAVNGATAYAVFKNDVLVAITEGTSVEVGTKEDGDTFTIRSANQRGGFGKAAAVEEKTTIIHLINPEALKAKDENIYNISGQRINAPQKGINIINGKKVIR